MTARREAITSSDTKWWSRSRCRVFYDAHTPDFADPAQRGNADAFPVLRDVNPVRDLELMAEAGVDSVVLFAKCQYGNSYHPTEVGRQHSALDGRDLFGEQLAAAHSMGIRVIAYFSNMWDVAAAAASPQWALQPSPARSRTGRWPALCLRSGYREYAHEQVREIARRYPIDALWSDILTAGPCVCERCSAVYRERFGTDVPSQRTQSGWNDLIDSSQQTVLDYLAEQRHILREERPEAALIPNFYATPFVDPVTGLRTEHLDLADVGSTEGYTDWHDLAFPSFASTYISAAAQGKPTEVLVSRFVHTWDFTLRSESQLRFESFTVAAHGATVSLDDQPYPSGAIEPEVYRRMKPVYGRIAQRARWTTDVAPVRFAALYANETSRRLESILGAPENPAIGEQSAQFPPSETRSSRSDLDAALSGTYKACVESHLPIEFTDDREPALARLQDFEVVILADVLSMGERAAQALSDYVHAGGGLLVTGECGVVDAEGRPEVQPILRELLGVSFGALDRFEYPYVELGGELSDRLGAWPLPHYGRMRSLENIAVDATVLATRREPVLRTDSKTFWHNNQPGPGRDSGGPVIIERTVGAGRVIVSAARLGNNHARLGHEGYRELLAALAVRAAGRQPEVTIEGGHRNTEMVLRRRDGELIVHLVTGYPVARLDIHGASQPQSVEDVASVAELVLRVPDDVSAAYRVIDGELSPLVMEANGVRLAGLDDWETVVLKR